MRRDFLIAFVAVMSMLLVYGQLQALEDAQLATEREAAEKVDRADAAWKSDQ